MKLTNEQASRQTKAVWILAAVLGITSASAALEISTLPSPHSSVPVAKATVRRVLVSIPDRRLALLENGKPVRVYRVAVGKASTPSPAGEFKIVSRVTNPTYYHKGQVIGAGKNNPVGSRWMGLSAKGYGIHGTNQPSSIGKAASTGCIRMRKKDLEELFAMVDVGDAVQIRAERDQQLASIFGADAGSQTIAPVETSSSAGGGQ